MASSFSDDDDSPPSDSASITQKVGQELKSNPPKILASTRRKFGAPDAKHQKVAILLSKSRKLGAKIPSPPGARSKL